MKATLFIKPHGKSQEIDIIQIDKEDEQFLIENNIKLSMEELDDDNNVIYFDYGETNEEDEPEEYIELSNNRSCIDTIKSAVIELKKILNK